MLTCLFTCSYVTNQLREGDMAVFFGHENQLHPPFLSDQGILRSSKKSDIIEHIKPSVLQDEETNFDC